MKMTTKVRYGLRIMLQIAEDNVKGQLAKGRLIAAKQEIPKNYMEQIIIPLKKHGLVVSERGIKGGYRLSRDPKEITLKEIIEVLEGQIQLVKCRTRNSICQRYYDCPARKAWSALNETIHEKTSSITLHSILANAG